MNFSGKIFRMFISSFIIISFQCLNGQYIVKQIEYDIPVSYSLVPDNREFNNAQEEMDYFLNMSVDKLTKAALAGGNEVIQEKSTLYLDHGDFAIETESEDLGKTTMVSDMKTGIMHTIFWNQKKVMEMKPEDIKKMQERSKAIADKMLQKLPPEMREQIKADMQKNKQGTPEKYNARSTGRKMKVNGFNCEEYRIEKEDETILVWASGEYSKLAGDVDRISNQFNLMYQSDDDEDVDEWQLVPGKIPVEVRTYRTSMAMGEPVINIRSILKIENKKPSAAVFKVPGEKDGFTSGSMMDMMKQMMPGDEQN